MKTLSKIIIVAVSAGFLGAGALVLNSQGLNVAQAQTQSAKALVDRAIAEGKVGETAAGYLAAVNGQALDRATEAAMNEVNIGRKSVYTRLARDQGVKPEVVAALTGEKQIANAARGEYVMTATGWKKK
jgi:uncharacterized protein YdbL (DUF1318 family)